MRITGGFGEKLEEGGGDNFGILTLALVGCLLPPFVPLLEPLATYLSTVGGKGNCTIHIASTDYPKIHGT